MTKPCSILIIGGGPAAMFFCHALERQRKEMIAAGEDTSNLPIVTVLEQAPEPGGVWRAKSSTVTGDKTQNFEKVNEVNMYEGLWTNGPKELIEFFDYTFDEHFGQALPVYLPRHAVLGYMLARVKHACPDFFQKYFTFNVAVQSVDWNSQTNQFDVVSKNLITGCVMTDSYDKCVWAAGENGLRKIPDAMVTMFREGGFTGPMIHSSECSNFEEHIRGKRILMIGGSYSAEDLALMAIKVGAEMIYISTRHEDNVVTWTNTWPGGKVELLVEMQPVKVTQGGKCVQFAEVIRHHGDVFEVLESIETEIWNISTVIFCTGYLANLGMLSEELRKPFYLQQDPFSHLMEVPQDWEMQDAHLPPKLRGVEPGANCLWAKSSIPFPDMYRYTLIDNPNMMYMCSWIEAPLLSLEVAAHFLVRVCTGRNTLEPPNEQRRFNKERALITMASNSMIRYEVDSKFFSLINSIYSDGTEEEVEEMDELLAKEGKDQRITEFCSTAQLMRDCHYPVDIGTLDQLNDTGNLLFHMSVLDDKHRTILETDDNKESYWKTFRDCDDTSEFKSIFTGTVAVPFPTRWMDIDNINEVACPKQTEV